MSRSLVYIPVRLPGENLLHGPPPQRTEYSARAVGRRSWNEWSMLGDVVPEVEPEVVREVVPEACLGVGEWLGQCPRGGQLA